MQLGPWLARPDQGRWEDHSMESHVVFSHELIQLHILLVLPPLLPLVGVPSSDRDITDRSVKPDIEHFVGELIDGNFGSPLEITRNASAEQTFLEHRLREADRVCGPFALD